MSSEYYHCTSKENIELIKKSGWIGTDYFGKKGVYLADDPYECQYHGEKIIVIDSMFIDEKDLSTDDVNDGILHNGSIPFMDFDVYDTQTFLRLHKLSLLEENEQN